MRANPSNCRVLPSVGTSSGSLRWFTFGRTAGRATQPELIYSEGFYFEPRAGSEVRIFGFCNNEEKKEKRGGQISLSTVFFVQSRRFLVVQKRHLI